MTKDEYKIILNKAWIARGSIINETSLLEKHIEQIIANYFCSNSDIGDELINVILSEKMTFDAKRHTLRYVIEKSHTKFNSENSTWFNDMEQIMKDRNIFAHYPLDTRPESFNEYKNSNRIGFTRFRNKIEVIYYSDEDLHKKTSLIVKYIAEFRKLLGLPYNTN